MTTSTLITAAVTLAVCMVNNWIISRQAKEQHDRTMTIIECKIDELSRRQDKHNSMIERVYKLEKEADVFDEKIKVINHRVEDLEKTASK